MDYPQEKTYHLAKNGCKAVDFWASLPICSNSANLEAVKTYEGTHEMHTLIIGEDITGYAAFE